jgi:hypothetical protein
MDGLADVLKAITDAKTPLAIFIILAVVLAAIVWQVSKRAALSEKTTQTLVVGGYGLVGLLVAAGLATVLIPLWRVPPPPPPPQSTDVTIAGKVFAGGDQRAGLVDAMVHLEPLADLPEHNATTDANGEFSADFQAMRMVSGVMWVTEDKYNPTSQAFFSIDPANPAPPKQFIDMGEPLTSVATNPPPATAPAPQAPNAAAPAPPAPAAATPAAAQPMAAHYHHVAFNPALAAHVIAMPHNAVAAIVLSPKPAQAVAANTATGTTAPVAATFRPRMNYDALFAKIETDEVALSNAATAAFDDGQWAQAIRFILQAQKVSKTDVWKLTYPKLAAAYFLTGQAKLGHDTVAALRAERARPNSMLASPVAQRYFARDAAAMPATLAPANRAEIDSALH